MRPAVVLHGQLTSFLCSCVGLGQHEFERSLRGRLRLRLGGFGSVSRKPTFDETHLLEAPPPSGGMVL